MKSYPIIEKLANEFRNQHGISSNAPLNLKSLLLKLEVTSFFKPLSSRFSGMAIKSKDDKFMLINTSQNIARQNFTICHELYHLFVQKDFTFETTMKVGQFNRFDKNEMYADLFASYLLMPSDAIFSIAPDEEIDGKGSLTLDTIVKLEQYFQVSRSAMLFRLLGLNLINKFEKEGYSVGVINSAIRRGYDDSLYRETCHTGIIGSYGDLANHLVENEKISEGDYYSLMMDIDVDVASLKKESDD